MKRSFILALLIVIFAIGNTVSGQVSQFGIVKQYDGKNKKKPLSGVTINVEGAGSTVSNGQGEFVLKFVSLKRGDAVKCNNISKTGYEIFNKDALEQWNINPDQPFTIVLCRADMIKQIADNYYAASSASYARQMKKEQDQLRRAYEKGKIKEEELNKRIVELESLLEQAMGSVREAANEFAYVDLEELSTEERRAVELLQKGDFAKGIAAYEKMGLVDGYINKKYDKQVIDRYINVCKLAGGTENLQKIGSLLDNIFRRDSTDTYIGDKLALRESELGNNSKALSIAKKCLKNVEGGGNLYQIAEHQQGVGVYYYYNDENKKAFEYLDKSEFNLCQALKSNNYRRDSVLASYIHLLNTKAPIYDALMQYDSAQSNYDRALALSKQLLDLDTSLFAQEYSTLCNNLGYHYNQLSNYPKAAEYLDEALKWVQHEKNEENRLNLMMSINFEQSRMYLGTEKYYKGVNCMQQALEACENLYKKDPLGYQKQYARKCRDLGWSMAFSNDYWEALKYINRSLLIYDSIEDMYPASTNHSKSIAHSYLGRIYYDMEDYDKSIENYEKALLFADEAYSSSHDVSVIRTFYSTESELGAMYYQKGNEKRGLELIKRSAMHLQVLYEAAPSTYKEDQYKIHMLLFTIYLQSGMAEEAVAEYLILKEVAPDDPTVKQVEELILNQR